MPRQARLDYIGAYHHVMGRGIDGYHIFKEKFDKKDFLTRLKKLNKESSMQIYAWVIMDNHFHFLYQTGETELSTFMRQLLTGYAISYNKRHKRRGYLFQNRYKSIVVNADEYFLPLVRYIHLNPVKANLVSLEKLDQYLWVGHHEIMYGQTKKLINSEEILNFFGSVKSQAISGYKDYLKEGINKEEKYFLGDGNMQGLGEEKAIRKKEDGVSVGDERVLGNENFIENILQQCDQEEPKQKTFKDVYDLIEKVSNLYEIAKDDLIEKKTKEVREARCIFLYGAVKYLGMSVKGAGRRLGIKDSAASSGLRRGRAVERERGVLGRLGEK